MTLFLAAVLLTLLALCWDWPPAVTADAEREPASAGGKPLSGGPQQLESAGCPP